MQHCLCGSNMRSELATMKLSTASFAVSFLLCAVAVLCDDGTFEEAISLCDRDARLDRLERHLTVQQRELRQLRTRLTDVEAEKDAYRAELQTQKAALRTALTKLSSVLRGSSNHNAPDPKSTDPSLVTPHLHDVMARSDDDSPLMPVVMQMSARMTEMKADMQALHYSNNQRLTEMKADMQALKNSNNQRLTEMKTDMQALHNSNSQQSMDIQAALTSTFVHWGSSGCSSASDLVYSGVVGGSYYNNPGGATNYLCLTMSPVSSNHPYPGSDHTASLYGGEYQTYDATSDNRDPLCAVCRSRLPSTIMIPGTSVCTPGWRTQYSGYLMAGVYDDAAGSEFICVDSKLQSRPGSGDNHNGKLLYFTHTMCGSLPCGPYVENTIVTCAVCSK